eukprot:11181583-Lingulodinium_polyedra.AAC.1
MAQTGARCQQVHASKLPGEIRCQTQRDGRDPAGSVKEYTGRGELVWERLRDALRSVGNTESEED